ncbi:UDP-2,3-diacylglucosamine diphosphatase [Geminicoccaceae bacterium 1502E]|nr:UDP-2,3-diacylglucosamine diphosphatase [Geminicoccaceae bacterium 1502E]
MRAGRNNTPWWLVESGAARAHADTLVISDVHLGLRSSRPRSLLETLRGWHCRRLVLLGDILHEDFRGLCADGWAFLHYVRHQAASGVEVVWLHGNHDRHLAPEIVRFLGVEPRERYDWTLAGCRYTAVHGDAFDRFIAGNERVARWVSRLYTFCQHRLSSEGRWPGLLDRWHSQLLGLHEKVAAGAAALARQHGRDVILCGHTHQPLERRFAAPGERAVTYVNAGSWVERPASFLSIDAQAVRINHCP